MSRMLLWQFPTLGSVGRHSYVSLTFPWRRRGKRKIPGRKEARDRGRAKDCGRRLSRWSLSSPRWLLSNFRCKPPASPPPPPSPPSSSIEGGWATGPPSLSCWLPSMMIPRHPIGGSEFKLREEIGRSEKWRQSQLRGGDKCFDLKVG